jgi:hypothetical protein
VINANAIKASMLGYDDTLETIINDKTVTIKIPCIPINEMPCDHAWVVRLTMD